MLSFFRSNLDWLSRATNWAKFSATASLGVIHKVSHRSPFHLLLVKCHCLKGYGKQIELTKFAVSSQCILPRTPLVKEL